LPTTVTIGFIRYKVSVYVPTPIRCGKCQRYGHKSQQCKRQEPRCPRCTEPHEYNKCTATDEQIKCANCGDKHSSGYKGCKKYREVSSVLRTAATQKISYRDALKQTRAVSNDRQKPVGSTKEVEIAPTMERSAPQKRTADTQTDSEQAIQTEEKSDRIMSEEQMTTLLRTTATALLWIIKEMRPTVQQAQVTAQLQTIAEILGVVSRRRNSEPGVQVANIVPDPVPGSSAPAAAAVANYQ